MGSELKGVFAVLFCGLFFGDRYTRYRKEQEKLHNEWLERKKEREMRAKKEAEKKRGMGGDDLDDEEPEPSLR